MGRLLVFVKWKWTSSHWFWYKSFTTNC